MTTAGSAFSRGLDGGYTRHVVDRDHAVQIAAADQLQVVFVRRIGNEARRAEQHVIAMLRNHGLDAAQYAGVKGSLKIGS